MISQFSNMTSSLNIFDVVLFLSSSLVTGPSSMLISSLVQELDNFFLEGIDQKSSNRKYPCLRFAQYLKTGASKEYQIWHKRFWWNVTECCWCLQMAQKRNTWLKYVNDKKKVIDLPTVLLFLLDRVQFSGFIIMKPLHITPADSLAIFQKYKQRDCMKKVHVEV